MKDIDILALRDVKEAIKILDLYVKIANSMFEVIDLTKMGGDDVVSLANTTHIQEEAMLDSIDSTYTSALGCAHFWGLNFLNYILRKTEFNLVGIVKRDGEFAVEGEFPVKKFSLTWRKVPELDWRDAFDTGALVYRVIARVAVRELEKEKEE